MTDSIDKKPKEKWDSLDADLDAMLDEAESSLAPSNDFQDDEDAIDRLLRDAELDADDALEEVDEKDDFDRYWDEDDDNEPEIAQIADADKLRQIAEDSAALGKEDETVAEESSPVSSNSFQDDEEDAIDRLLRDAELGVDDALGEKDEFGSDWDEVGDFDGPEIAQIADVAKPGQSAEDLAALVGDEAVAEEASPVSLNEPQSDEDAIDRLLMDGWVDEDDVSLVNESDKDGAIDEPEIIRTVETGESEQIAETVPEQADENQDALIADETDEAAIAEAGTLDEFDDFLDFSDFNEPEITQTDETNKSEQIAEEPVALVEEPQPVEDELEQSVEQPDALVVDEALLVDEAGDGLTEPEMIQEDEIETAVPLTEDSAALVEVSQPAETPSLAPANDLQNEEDAIDRLLQDTGFDADDLLRDDVDAFSGFGEIKDDFSGLNMILEDDDKKTVPVADPASLDDDRQAGSFANAAEKRGDLMDDEKDLDEIDEFARLDEVGDIFVEQNTDGLTDESDQQEEQIQQAEPEETVTQSVPEDDFLLPDFDITADMENPDTWNDAGIEEDKLAGEFSEPDLFSDDDGLEDELEKIGRATGLNVPPAEIKPKQSSGDNAAIIEDVKNAAASQANLEPELLTEEQYRKQVIDAEKRAKRATIFSYVALGFGIVTFVAATALAVVAYSARTEISRLIDLVSALEQGGTGDGAVKSLAKEENKAPEVAEEQGIVGKVLAILQEKISAPEKKEPVEAPVAEAAKAEAITEPEAVKPEAEAAKAEAVSEPETVKPEAVPNEEAKKPEVETVKAEAKPEAKTAKPKTGTAKTGAVTETETANPEADTVKSVAVLKAAVDKAVAPKKTAAKKETVKKKPVKPAIKAVVPVVNWTVYLTAYKQEWYAKSKAAEFKQKGVPVEVVPGNVNNTAWYRLRVRGFKNKGEAASYAARIKKALNLSSVSVSEN